MTCYDSNLEHVWQLNITGVDSIARFYDDVIYWGGGGQGWQGAPVHKISYDGKIIWTKKFDGITYPLRGDIALLRAEGEGSTGLRLVDMETEEMLTHIHQRKRNFAIKETTTDQFTIKFSDTYTSYNDESAIWVTYDIKGNILHQE